MKLPIDELKYMIEVAEALSNEANGFGRLVTARIEIEIQERPLVLVYENNEWALEQTADDER